MEANDGGGALALALAQKELKLLGTVPSSIYHPSAPFLHSAFPTEENVQRSRQLSRNILPSKELSQLYEYIFRKEIRKKYILGARSSAIKILRNLFLKRMKDIEHSIRNIPYIPDVAQLRSVDNEHNKEMKELTLDGRLRLLCQLLRHDSSFVRHIALKKLYSIFVSRRAQISSMVCGDDAGMSGGVYVLPTQSSISLLLQELLHLCSKESDAGVIEMCAKCLGEHT